MEAGMTQCDIDLATDPREAEEERTKCCGAWHRHNPEYTHCRKAGCAKLLCRFCLVRCQECGQPYCAECLHTETFYEPGCKPYTVERICEGCSEEYRYEILCIAMEAVWRD